MQHAAVDAEEAGVRQADVVVSLQDASGDGGVAGVGAERSWQRQFAGSALNDGERAAAAGAIANVEAIGAVVGVVDDECAVAESGFTFGVFDFAPPVAAEMPATVTVLP